MGVSAPSYGRRAAQTRRASRTGDRVLFGLCVLAGAIVAVTLIDLGYQLVNNASPAINRFGLGFLGHERWAPNFQVFGAADLIYGTAVCSRSRW